MQTRKELKQAYKLKKFKMGVYQIRNAQNGKIFLGSNNNLDAIWNRHRLQLNMGSHPNKQLQEDWKKLGDENFVYEILEEIEQNEEITDYAKEIKTLETLYLDALQPYEEKGYNKRPKT